MRAWLSLLVALSALACASDPEATGSPTTGGARTTGGMANGGAGSMDAGGAMSTGGNDGNGGAPVACTLPTIGSAGQPRPAGAPGGFTVLDWAGFQGAVSYTFDDANSSQLANYAALAALGVRMTFYLQTGKATAAEPIWAEAVAAGHELGNHSQAHAQTGTAADLDAATAFIETHFGVRPYTMAAPYGNASYQPLAETRFLINRGVANAIIAPNGTANPFDLPCYIPPTGALASDFDAQIDAARTAGGWRVVLVHGFTGGSDGAYQPVSIDEFVASVNHAKSFGDLWLDTVENVGAYWRAQKLLTGVSPVSAGGTSTWSWTLPANFPPGKCLRVRVDGGTLTQGGQELAWDEHGYYQLALDAGEVALAP